MSDSTDVIREALRSGEGRRELAAQRGEFEGADLTIHKITATPDRETHW